MWPFSASLKPVRSYLKSVATPAFRPSSSPPPAFEPEAWNNDPIRERALCYSYALNFKPPSDDFKWAQPGDFSETVPALTGNAAFDGAVADGAIPTPLKDPPALEGYYLIALFQNSSGTDWHWYRQDADGTWSSKDGEDYIKRTDFNGERITDPRRADHDYNCRTFVSFFYAPNDGLASVKALTAAPHRPQAPDAAAEPHI